MFSQVSVGVLCPGGSLSGGSLSRGVSVREIPPERLRADGKHPTGMHSCFNIISGWGTKARASNYFRWGVRALVVRRTGGQSVCNRGSCSGFTEPRRERTTNAASRIRQDPSTSGQKVNSQKFTWSQVHGAKRLQNGKQSDLCSKN